MVHVIIPLELVFVARDGRVLLVTCAPLIITIPLVTIVCTQNMQEKQNFHIFFQIATQLRHATPMEPAIIVLATACAALVGEVVHAMFVRLTTMAPPATHVCIVDVLEFIELQM